MQERKRSLVVFKFMSNTTYKVKFKGGKNQVCVAMVAAKHDVLHVIWNPKFIFPWNENARVSELYV